MLLLLCSRADVSAHTFAQRWAAHGVRAVTCRDLSRAGWKLELSCPGGAEPDRLVQAVVGDTRVAADEIEAVITRLPFVDESELSHIVAEDRAYVAAEMHAFLFAFLSALTCPVVNRPTPACLSGPNWRPIHWRHQAARLGIPLMQSHFRVALNAGGYSQANDLLPNTAKQCREVAVVGDRVIGDVATPALGWARQLAGASGVELLRVWFAGTDRDARFAGADLWPNVESDSVAHALFEHLGKRAPC